MEGLASVGDMGIGESAYIAVTLVETGGSACAGSVARAIGPPAAFRIYVSHQKWNKVIRLSLLVQFFATWFHR